MNWRLGSINCFLLPIRLTKNLLRLLDTNFESLKNLMMLYIVGKVLASLVEFSNVDDVASCVTQQHMNFVTKREVAKTAVDRVW